MSASFIVVFSTSGLFKHLLLKAAAEWQRSIVCETVTMEVTSWIIRRHRHGTFRHPRCQRVSNQQNHHVRLYKDPVSRFRGNFVPAPKAIPKSVRRSRRLPPSTRTDVHSCGEAGQCFNYCLSELTVAAAGSTRVTTWLGSMLTLRATARAVLSLSP